MVAITIAGGCGPRAVESRPAAHDRGVRWDGALTDLVPDDATLLVRARPAELVGAPASREVIATIASDERFERYRQHTGIDPRTLEELVWAECAEGSMLVIRGSFSAPLAVLEMAHRMLPVESSSDTPFVRRVGHYQGARRDITAISDHVLLVISGTPALAESILALALGDRRGTALADPLAGALWSAHDAAPLVILAPRPLGLPRETAVGLLLAREQALVATATPIDASVGLGVELRGDFPPGADANFRALIESLAESDLGMAVGMRDAVETLTVHADPGQVVLHARVPAPALAAGLRILFEAEIAELVDETEGGGEASAPPALGVRAP